MSQSERMLLSGNEAVAQAAFDAGVSLGAGYPGTPSTEILERFSELGGRAQWSPNEKVALEVCLGAAYAGARALVTMKHVGLNVASDPLFTAAYTGVNGAMVVVSADDPGMASSQNEQDNRRYAVAAGVPMLEPADSQEAYDFLLAAVEGLNDNWSVWLHDRARKGPNIRGLPIRDGRAYAELDLVPGEPSTVLGPGLDLFIGHPVVCDQPDVGLLVSWMEPGLWFVEAHNPTDAPLKAELRSSKGWTKFALSESVELAPGTSRIWRVPEARGAAD